MARIILFDLPEEPSQRARWLERQLCSPDCGLLIGELEALRSMDPEIASLNEPQPLRSLDDVLGPLKEEVLSHGLSALPREKIELFFTNPELIAELMIEVELSESEYWRSISRIAAEDSADTKLPNALPQPPSEDSPRNRASTWLAVLTALAATILIAIVMTNQAGPMKLAWERPGVFDVQLGREAYLEHLAVTAQEWLDDAPRDRAHLTDKITSFRRGCDLLLASSHPQLPESDREWLRERCENWSKKFDAQLQSLQAGSDWNTVSTEANDTVAKLQKALRDRISAAA